MIHIHPHAVQRPTAVLHVRNMHDAHVILEAVRLNRLQPVTRRLNEVERMTFIRSGCVFVWEESEDDLGLRRWTDGLLWTASRMREPFLFYETRTLTPSATKSGLVKQTYSAIVTLPGSRPADPPIVRKWHLTAYFDHNDIASLRTIDDDPILSNIAVPPGVYRSGKSRQARQPRVDPNPGGFRWMNVGDSSTGRTASWSASDAGASVSASSTETSSRSSPSNSPELHGNARVMDLPPLSPITTSSPTSPYATRGPFSHRTPSPSQSPRYSSGYHRGGTPAMQRPHPYPYPYTHGSGSSGSGGSKVLPPLDVAFSDSPEGQPQNYARPPLMRSVSSEAARSTEDERVIKLLNRHTFK